MKKSFVIAYRIYLLPLFIFLSLPSFGKNGADSSAYKSVLNLAYGNAPDERNLLDIFLPNSPNPNTKMLVFIHGGYWTKGSKNQLPKALIQILAGKKGYAVASINYRLVKDNQNRYPVQMDDIQQALRFLNLKADSLGYKKGEFGLLGASAGAYLALMYAYTADPKKEIKTVIDIVGPTDFTDPMVRGKNLEADKTITNFLGVSDPNAPLAKESSPLLRVNAASAVPTIIFHGENDEVVHVQQAKNLYAKLSQLGIKTQLELYPNETHEMRKSLFSVFLKMGTWLDQVYPSGVKN
ncbi:alpha/beta hydrolase [Aquirufa aurantiipilula]|uniref:Alpha/beta hydrolase n=1 Tax=Aquirufa aurantiipilula TaxID=2696561 RepID=A0ABT6BM77_9BACT|nr:alpha/beta hydrolase [Aquirufa aurantiipilula]MDF5691290.1 alpha/beta hydrolase [Aquirufa aurantiipilula]